MEIITEIKNTKLKRTWGGKTLVSIKGCFSVHPSPFLNQKNTLSCGLIHY